MVRLNKIDELMLRFLQDPSQVFPDTPAGNCGLCHKRCEENDLRPYGPGGIMICYPCGQLDIETTERECNKFINKQIDSAVPQNG